MFFSIPTFLLIIVSFLILAFVVMVVSVLVGVPFLPVHRRQAELMVKLAELKPGMTAIDLGSGAGRFLFLAAGQGAKAVGYELNPFLFWWTKLMIKANGLSGLVSVRLLSLYSAPIGDADVVFAFLLPRLMGSVEKKLFAELKPGAKIISYAFSLPNHAPTIKTEGIFVYEVGGGRCAQNA